MSEKCSILHFHLPKKAKNRTFCADSRLELDFVILCEARLLPIEVKAYGNMRANSLSQMLKENPELKAVRYSMLPYKEQGQMTNVGS